jgi:ATP-dependent protease HslVU (ClpYQ) peptidase subunit
VTCIVGLKHGNKIFIGGDRCGAEGYSVMARNESKVFIREDSLKRPYLFGYTSSFRMGQLLEFGLKIPDFVYGPLMKYMVSEFMEAVRSCLKDGGFSTIDKNEELGGCFMVACHGTLFRVDSDYQIFRSEDFMAVGCGEKFALGSLYATQEMELDPAFRIQEALDAAEHFSGAVMKPYDILSIPCLEQKEA